MFYCIDQPDTLGFPVGLVAGLGRWRLVLAVASVDAYPFFAFSDLTCHLKDTGVGVFWLHCDTR